MDTPDFLTDPAERPENGRAEFVQTSDGVRIRVAAWPGGAKGTVLLFPGRTEYVEKYGPAARDFLSRDYSVVTVDWRGQGLADRLAPDPMVGHVGHIRDFQHDVSAVMTWVQAQSDLPGPLHLLGHSMGAAIGLRALLDGLDVKSCAFSGPMWGILIRPHMRPFAYLIGATAMALGLGARPIPLMDSSSYGPRQPFEGNVLTTDPDMYAFMQRQVVENEALGLGPPSLAWLATSLSELASLKRAKLPEIPALVGIGDLERVVDPGAIEATARRWPGARFVRFANAEHELMMETPETRAAFFDACVETFEGH